MTDSRFDRRAPDSSERITFTLDGQPATGCAGDSVAGALLAHDAQPIRRTGPSGTERTPYCMMGVCFDCLVTIDGQPNRQACMVALTEGMDIRRQTGFRTAEGAT